MPQNSGAIEPVLPPDPAAPLPVFPRLRPKVRLVSIKIRCSHLAITERLDSCK